MKVCILSIVNVKHMSAASLYLDYFREHNIKYDIIYIDKYLKPEKIDAENIYRFELPIDRNWPRIKKIREYYKFRKYAKQVLAKNKYDLVITWGTETTFLLFDYLIGKLKNRYIVNIRDYANLDNKLKYILLKNIVKNSKFTTISSNGFRHFLPPYNYTLVHSVNKGVLSQATPKLKLKENIDPIRICFIGYVRFYDNDKKLINSLGNDSRFILQYFGVGSEVLERYALENRIYNVEFINGFDVEETGKLLNRADIINNLYGYNDIALDTAVSIKYYHAINLNMPILVYKGTFMEEIAGDIAFVFNDDYKDLGDRIHEWYMNLSFNELKKECNHRIEKTRNENRTFYLKLSESLRL